MPLRGILFASLIALSWPAGAQSKSGAPASGPSCGVLDDGLSGDLAGWKTKTNLEATGGRGNLKDALMRPGVAYDLALLPTPAVTYARQPEKPGGSVSYGGMLSLKIARAGTYVVALGSGAWIDMLKGHEAIISTAHGHGPACSTIHKMVEFPLTPGRYTIQIAANGTSNIALLVALKP